MTTIIILAIQIAVIVAVNRWHTKQLKNNQYNSSLPYDPGQLGRILDKNDRATMIANTITIGSAIIAIPLMFIIK